MKHTSASIPFFLILVLLFAVEGSWAWSGGDYPVSYGEMALTSEPGPGWKEFVSSTGKGWNGRFEARRGVVHRAYGPPISLKISPLPDIAETEAGSREFIDDNEVLFGVSEEDLEIADVRHIGSTWYLDFRQTFKGVPVLGGRVLMRVSDDGNLFMFGAETVPDVQVGTIPSISKTRATILARQYSQADELTTQEMGQRLVIVPDVADANRRFTLCWEVRLRTENPPGNWFIYVSADDESLVRKVDRTCRFSISGNVTGEMLPQFYDEVPVVVAFANELVKLWDTDSSVTNTLGDYEIPVDFPGYYLLSSKLYGDYAEVINEDGAEASHADTAYTNEPHDWTWRSPDDGLPDELNVYYHINRIHDWIKGRPFYFNEVDYRMKATVRWGVNYDNAFYDGRDIYFGEGSNGPGGMRNLALFSDVIYHEYTHAITDRIYSTTGDGEFFAMMEGFSDYVAATLNDDPFLGNGGLNISTPYDRTLYNDLRFPEDFGISAHYAGQIVAGAVWDLRHYEWPALADKLWFYAILGEPLTFEDFLMEVLLADDDNGNLADGTPHDCSIYQAFGRHGIGPGSDIVIDHMPRKDTERWGEPIPVYAKVYCEEPAPPVRLHYMADPVQNFVWTMMTKTENPNEYVGEIYPMPSGTQVKYYINAGCVRLPSGAPEWDSYEFYVGPDTIPPQIVHQELPDRAIEGWPPEVHAKVTDNLAVEQVPLLEYKINSIDQVPLDMERKAGTDIYSVQMGASPQVGDTVEYRIVAHDSSQASNIIFAPSDTSYYAFRVCHGFFDDMGSGADGWTHATTPRYVDEWRLTSRDHFGVYDTMSWGCGQDDGNYSDYNHSLLVTPIINVDYDSRLLFWHRMVAETLDDYRGFDAGVVEVSRDSGKTWEHVLPNLGYPFAFAPSPGSPLPSGIRCYSGSFEWEPAEFSLAPFYGDIQIRFRFGSNSEKTEEGWYIDDVQVIGCPETGILETRREKRQQIRFELQQPYPNPALSDVVLEYSIPEKSHVRLRVYNIAGQLVRTLIDSEADPGRAIAFWDGRDGAGERVANGVYFAVLAAGGRLKTHKMQLLH